MKVLLITGEYPPMRGGVADYSSLLSDGLRHLGVELTVLTSIRAAREGRPTADAVEPTVSEWGTSVWHDVAKQIAILRPDVIHIQYQTGAFGMRLGINLLPWVRRLGRGRAPIVVTFHDLKEPYVLPKIGRARHLATMALAAGSDAIVVTNPEDFKRVAGSAENGRSRIWWGRRPVTATPIGSNIPPLASGFDRDHTRTLIGARREDFVVTFFGFLVPSKGLESLVDAFETLISQGRSVRLLMVGAGAGDSSHPDRRYEHLIRQRLDHPRLGGRVSWTGFLHPSDVAAYLSAADVCCLPFRDGVSLRHGTLVAAISLGLPIVTTDGPGAVAHGSFPSLVAERNVLLVSSKDSLRLVDELARLIDDPGLRTRIANGSRELACSFGWDGIAQKTLAVYQEVLRA